MRGYYALNSWLSCHACASTPSPQTRDLCWVLYSRMQTEHGFCFGLSHRRTRTRPLPASLSCVPALSAHLSAV